MRRLWGSSPLALSTNRTTRRFSTSQPSFSVSSGSAPPPPSRLSLGLNQEIPDWWGFSQPEVSIAAGDNVTDDVSVVIPQANRDSDGNVSSIPAGKNAVIYRFMTPGDKTLQYTLTWTEVGGSGAAGSVYTTQFMTGVDLSQLSSGNVKFTSQYNQADETNTPAIGFTLSPGKYIKNLVCRPTIDPGGVLDAKFAANTSAVIKGGFNRFTKWTSVELNNSPRNPSGSGPTISSITFVGTTATLTTATAHNLTSGNSITVTGATPTTYNVTNALVTVTSPTTFTYTMGGTPTGNATVMGSYTWGDSNATLGQLYFPNPASEPGTLLNDPVYTTGNRNRNINDIHYHDGAAVERIINVATAMTGAGIWYNAPWNADATFYQDVAAKFATYAQSTGKKVAVELNNEVWNDGYPGSHQCFNEANFRGTQSDARPQCRVVATSNITLSGTQTIDGFAVVAGDHVLCVGQTTASQNGSYVVAAGAWSRAEATISSGDFWYVTTGLTNAQTSWRVSTTGAITVGTTPLTIAQFTKRQRYAEKFIAVMAYFETAFANAGVSNLLVRTACWQNAASPNIWDEILGFSTMASHVDMCATAVYYDAIGINGIAANYTGAVGPVATAMNTSMDNVIGLAVGHQNKVVNTWGKLFGLYEAGYGSQFTDLTFRQTYNRSSSAYDVQLRFAQQLELRLPNIYANIFAFCYPINSGSNNAWGLLETGYATPDKTNSPKFKALADFNNNVRALSAATGTISNATQANPVGTLLGTVTPSVYGAALSLSNNDSGNVAIDSSGRVTVAQSLSGATLGSHSFTVRQTDARDATGFFDTVFNYQITPALLQDAFSGSSLDGTKWTTGTGLLGVSSYTSTGCTVSEGSGSLQIATPVTSGRGLGIISVNPVDLTQNTAHFAHMASSASGNGAGGMTYGAVGGAVINATIRNNIIALESRDGTSGYSLLASMSGYVAATHAWIRLRYDPAGTNFYVDTAPETAANPPASGDWVQQIGPIAKPVGLNVTTGDIGLFSRDDDSVAVTMTFTGFNTAHA